MFANLAIREMDGNALPSESAWAAMATMRVLAAPVVLDSTKTDCTAAAPFHALFDAGIFHLQMWQLRKFEI
jgi:hypothetical protein